MAKMGNSALYALVRRVTLNSSIDAFTNSKSFVDSGELTYWYQNIYIQVYIYIIQNEVKGGSPTLFR